MSGIARFLLLNVFGGDNHRWSVLHHRLGTRILSEVLLHPPDAVLSQMFVTPHEAIGRQTRIARQVFLCLRRAEGDVDPGKIATVLLPAKTLDAEYFDDEAMEQGGMRPVEVQVDCVRQNRRITGLAEQRELAAQLRLLDCLEKPDRSGEEVRGD